MDVGENKYLILMKDKAEREVKMEEKRNIYLIYELYKEMEVELNKGAVRMNTTKIKYIVLLLEQLEGRDYLLPEMDKDKFFEELEKKIWI